MNAQANRKEHANILSDLSRVKPWALGTMIALLLVVIAGLVGLGFPLTRDESYHWAVTSLFGSGLPSIKVLASYYAGPGPLPYIIWGNLRALGAGLPLLRATSTLFLLLAVLGLVKVARELRAPSVPILVAFILVQPYILTNAFLLMTDCLALVLAVWALYGVLAATRTGYTKYWILAGIAAACVLYTRIPYLSIPAGLGLSALIGRTGRRQALATAMLSIAAVGPLIALWGGFASLTNQQAHHLTFRVQHYNHLLAWLGFFYWPYLLTRIKWDSTKAKLLWVLPVFLGGCLATWFLPFGGGVAGALPAFERSPETAGVVDHLIILSGEFGLGWLPHIFYFLLWGMGLSAVTHIAFQSWPIPARRTILFMALCAAVLPGLQPYWWERHAIPAYLLVGILAWSEPMKRRWIPIAWLSILAVLAIAHLVHVVVYLG